MAPYRDKYYCAEIWTIVLCYYTQKLGYNSSLLVFQKMEVESLQLGGAAELGAHPKVTPLDRSAWI